MLHMSSGRHGIDPLPVENQTVSHQENRNTPLIIIKALIQQNQKNKKTNSLLKGIKSIFSSTSESSTEQQLGQQEEKQTTAINQGEEVNEMTTSYFDNQSPGAVAYGTTHDLLASDHTSPTLEDIGVTYETLKAMLQREEELRLSPETQQRHRERGQKAYPEISADCQIQVANEFGYTGAKQEFGVQLLRCAESLVRKNSQRLAEVQQISFYRRYNRLQDGYLKEGDQAAFPAHPLIAFDDSLAEVDFSVYVHDRMSKPLLVLAGSYS